MGEEIGVPIKDFIEAVVTSYKKGFDDGIECLKSASETIDMEKMKQTVEAEMQKRGKIKAEW